MRTDVLSLAVMLSLLIARPALATDDHISEHGGQTFHAFRLETDIGDSREGTIASWDFDGWVGSDENKLWLKSEGESVDGDKHQEEFWALYSRNVAEFWDVQIGLRHDTEPTHTSYLVTGFSGLAPYLFETEVHLFVSNDGDISARLREENDFLVTQQFILQPYAEFNLFVSDVSELDVGSGLSTGEIGLQARYEIARKIAPYVDFRYERSFGETASIAKASGEPRDDFISSIGIRLMF